MPTIKNANFNNVPPFTAVQTSDNWMDGTATGSSTNTYGWWMSVRASGVSAQFDTSTLFGDSAASLKLSTTDATGRCRVFNCIASAGNITANSTNQPYLIPAMPNTSYTFMAYCKTNNVASGGALIEIVELNSSFTVGASNASNALTGTNGFTLLTVTVTTASTCAYIAVDMQNATAGNISDAWFASLALKGPKEIRTFQPRNNLRPHPFSPGIAR